MEISRRALFGSTITMVVPITSGCFSLNADGGSETTKPNAAGGRGAAKIFAHNLHKDPITVSIRAETIDPHQKQDEEVPIDETMQIESSETHQINNKVLFHSEYSISVSLDGGYAEDADWTPDAGGGLHLLYDGSDNISFAEEFA